MALMPFGLAACGDDTPATDDTTGGTNLPMHLAISRSSDEAQGTEAYFAVGDKIGLYVAAADKPLQIGGNMVNNEPLTFDGSNWKATHNLRWDDGTYDIYAYYPYIKEVSSIDDQPFSVCLDQSTARDGDKPGGYEASDLLHAASKGMAASDNTVHLTFGHIMSKLTIRLIKGEDFEGDMPADATVYVHNTVTAATIDLQAGVATRDAKGGRNTITAHHDDNIYSAIVVPQRMANRMPLIEVVMGNTSYIYESTFLFKPGTEHLVNLIIPSDPDKTTIDIGGDTKPWN